MRLGVLASHPIQNHAPIFRELAARCDLTVYFAHRQTPDGQAQAGFGVAFEWDVDLLSGYRSCFLENRASRPATNRFLGCDTPEIGGEIRKNRFDAFVVTGWNLKSYWQAIWACRNADIPILIRGDSQLPAQRRLWLRTAKAVLYPRLLRSFDGCLYVGRRNYDYLRHYGFPDDRLFFSPHCVDNHAFATAATAARGPTDSPAASAPSAGRLLFAGKLVQRKRPLDLVEAAALVREAGCPVEAAFIGAGELEGELRQRAAERRLPVTFHGFKNQSELPALYAAADVLVLPSDSRETWGLVVNEAMACGLPAIVSDAVGCAPDLIDPGITGATYPVGDVDALAEAIRMVLMVDKQRLRRRLSATLEIYSPSRAAEGILGGARDLVARKRGRKEARGR